MFLQRHFKVAAAANTMAGLASFGGNGRFVGKVKNDRLGQSFAADMRNIGGPSGGTITASLFLNEFVNDTPWAHLDIAGPMKVDGDEGWMQKGATAFGTRLLIDTVCNFRAL